MVADDDFALGQLVSRISHSKIWSSSAIFVVEDDSQDGADHVDAHRIPALVHQPLRPARCGNPHALRPALGDPLDGADHGHEALGLSDALASPMYNVFSSKPFNSGAVSTIAPKVNLLARNGPSAICRRKRRADCHSGPRT